MIALLLQKCAKRTGVIQPARFIAEGVALPWRIYLCCSRSPEACNISRYSALAKQFRSRVWDIWTVCKVVCGLSNAYIFLLYIYIYLIIYIIIYIYIYLFIIALGFYRAFTFPMVVDSTSSLAGKIRGDLGTHSVLPALWCVMMRYDALGSFLLFSITRFIAASCGTCFWAFCATSLYCLDLFVSCKKQWLMVVLLIGWWVKASLRNSTDSPAKAGSLKLKMLQGVMYT